MLRCSGSKHGDNGLWPSGLRHFDRIRSFPVQTPVGTLAGIGTQFCYEAPGNPWVKT